MTQLSISQAAQTTGLTEDTLRYYERIGLLLNVERASSGHRRYSEDELMWIGFVQRLRGTGMSLERIQTYVELWRQGEHTAPERKALLEAHAAEVKAQIIKLQTSLDAIYFKLEHYRSFGTEQGDDNTCSTARPERTVPKRSLRSDKRTRRL